MFQTADWAFSMPFKALETELDWKLYLPGSLTKLNKFSPWEQEAR